MEVVVVVHAAKWARHLRVAKVLWWIELGDPRGQLEPDAEVARPPRDLVAQLEEAGSLARDDALSVRRHRMLVNVDVACEVEDRSSRRADRRLDANQRHGRNLRRGPPLGAAPPHVDGFPARTSWAALRRFLLIGARSFAINAALRRLATVGLTRT